MNLHFPGELASILLITEFYLPKSIIEALTLNVIVLRAGAFGR